MHHQSTVNPKATFHTYERFTFWKQSVTVYKMLINIHVKGPSIIIYRER